MRLSQISDRTLDYYDLSRAEARQEARAGQLWAASRTRIAVAPTAEAAAWMLRSSAVEQVKCSTQPEEILWDLREAVRRGRALSRRLGQVESSSWDPVLGWLEIPLGESAWGENSNGLGGSGLQAEVISWMGAAPISWSQSTSTHDEARPSYPSTVPLQWRRIIEEP